MKFSVSQTQDSRITRIQREDVWQKNLPAASEKMLLVVMNVVIHKKKQKNTSTTFFFIAKTKNSADFNLGRREQNLGEKKVAVRVKNNWVCCEVAGQQAALFQRPNLCCC